MRSHIFIHSHRTLAVAVVATLALAACGGGGDDDSSSATTPEPTGASGDDQASGATPGQNPFDAVIECLRAQGLEVDEPEFGGTGGTPNRGSLPSDLSVPEGGLPDGSVPGGSPPQGGFPGGSGPEGSFPAGSRPEGGPAAGGGFPGGGDPTFLASALGLDADDPNVVAAIETCSAELGG